MTLEQQFIPQRFEKASDTQQEHERAVESTTTRLGRHALDLSAFVLLGEVASPHEEIRQGLKAKVIDQDPAIDAIIEALDRTNIRTSNDHHPIANFAFLGPTGVGKSETAKTLAGLIGKNNLIQIDCSNFSNGHEVSSLVGAPPSFVGREQTPKLAKERVEQPGTVVLFDEIEKGSDQLYNLMLQIMGDGQLQLNDGDTVSFRDTVIIVTSNLGAKEMSRQLSTTSIGFGDPSRPTDRKTLEAVATKSFDDFFRPEFINRFNKKVVFHPLSANSLDGVLDVKLLEANEHYEAEFGVRLSLSEQTRAELVAQAMTEPHLGARPLIRALENDVQTTFGRYTDSGSLLEGTHVHVVHHTELPNASQQNDSPFLFMARSDPSIRKQQKPQPLAITQGPQTVPSFIDPGV